MDTTKFFDKKFESLKGRDDGGHIICSTCQTPLTDLVSMAAGMGPVCRDRTRFAETLSNEELIKLEGPKNEFSLQQKSLKTGLIKLKGEEHSRLVTVIKADKNFIYFFDRKEANSAYTESKISATESIVNSLKKIKTEECIYISSLLSPELQDLEEKFIKFQTDYREKLREKDEQKVVVGFPSVKSKKILDKDRVVARKSLIKQFHSKVNTKFKQNWESGDFALATLLFRLEQSSLKNANKLVETIKKYNNVESKDYGLTDDEILQGLRQAQKPIELQVASSLIKGVSNLTKLTEAYQVVKDSPSTNNYINLINLFE